MTTLNIAALIVVGFFAALLTVTGFAGMIRPDRIGLWIRSLLEKPSGWIVAATMRAVLGISLLLAASVSALPVTFQVLGWLALLGAVFVVVMRSRLLPFTERFLVAGAWPMRLACTAAALMGLALLYGVIPAS